MQPKGNFFISLDFELFWGVRDHRTLENYGPSIAAVHEVVPALLALFRQFDIHATWATVGFMFHRSKEELLQHIPGVLPEYEQPSLGPYAYLSTQPLESIYHFAPDLIKQIAATPGQEIATHTYSHFYTLEAGAGLDAFCADLDMALAVAAQQGYMIRSIVFPRNQYSAAHEAICLEKGVTGYRGNEESWIYQTRSRASETRFRRAFRLMDAYINLSGHHAFAVKPSPGQCINIPASRFLRPFSKKLAALDGLRLRRILHSMEHAAKNGLTFHLWWHPHNFGKNIAQNTSFLRKVLEHYSLLKDKYGMSSRNMLEIQESLIS